MSRLHGKVSTWCWLLVCAVVPSWAQTGDGSSTPSSKPVVYTTFYPTQYFAERIGGDAVKVVNPLPEDADPIFWNPSRQVIAAFHKADLIVLNGAGFEKWVDKVSLPQQKVVTTAQSFKDKWITYAHAVTHSHGSGEEHSHEGLDGHTWLNPLLAIAQAESIKEALVKKVPGGKKQFEAGFEDLRKDLMGLDSLLSGLKPPLLYASHPAYNYLAKQYDWKVINLDLDPGKMPSKKSFHDMHHKLKKQPAKILLWESLPNQEIRQAVEKKTGLKSVEFRPCESITSGERKKGDDYLSIMLQNAQRLNDAIGP